jgi:hypothetical protein
LHNVRDRLPEVQVAGSVEHAEANAEGAPAPAAAPPAPAAEAEVAIAEAGPTAMDTSEGPAAEPSESTPLLSAPEEPQQTSAPATAPATAPTTAPTTAPAPTEEPVVSEEQRMYAQRLTFLKGILSGETPINLTLQFLYSNNR